MFINLLYGLPIMAVCLLLQSLLVLVALRYYVHSETLVNEPTYWTALKVVNGVMLLMVIGNITQVAIWALLFRVLNEFSDFSEAFYHSAVNFATLGYGDFVMSEKHKLLGPLEAINGVLMIGVSTAALMATFRDAMKKTFQARNSDNRQ
jgi:hypothetical protein